MDAGALFEHFRQQDPVEAHRSQQGQLQLAFPLGIGQRADAAPLGAVTPLVGGQPLGPLKKFWYYRLAGGARTLAITFTPKGFFCLFRVLADRLAAGLTEPDALASTRCLAELWQQLRPVAQPARLVQLLAAFRRPYLHAPDPQQAELLAHLPLLGSHLNPLRVLAAASQRSKRAMQLRFQNSWASRQKKPPVSALLPLSSGAFPVRPARASARLEHPAGTPRLLRPKSPDSRFQSFPPAHPDRSSQPTAAHGHVLRSPFATTPLVVAG